MMIKNQSWRLEIALMALFVFYGYIIVPGDHLTPVFIENFYQMNLCSFLGLRSSIHIFLDKQTTKGACGNVLYIIGVLF